MFTLLHETIHHALRAGLVEGDGELLPSMAVTLPLPNFGGRRGRRLKVGDRAGGFETSRSMVTRRGRGLVR
jgi:hypothetical protein